LATDCLFLSRACKGVNEVLRFGVDYQDFMAPDESVTAVTVTVSPSGPTVSDDGVADGDGATGNIAVAMVEGGTAGVTYKVWVAATTTGGQELKRYVSLTVEAE
jgi:hypothetical protein